MQKNIYIFVAISLCGILGCMVFSQSGGAKYEDEIAQKRFEKDKFFRDSPQSPIKDKTKAKDLAYFSPQISYKIEAKVELLDKPTPVEVKMSKGETETYLRYAYLHFKLAGKPYKLLALRRSLREPFLWVGFRDETTGKETYGGGRYLDLAYRQGSKTVVIDFNLAYHPYCAYNVEYACPLPPQENTLPIAVRAGEKQ